MTRCCTTILLAIAALAGAGCTAPHADYPTRYALARDAYQGVTVTRADTKRFVEFFATLGRGSPPDVAAVYADGLYFSDSLLTTTDYHRVESHFRRMHENGTRIDIEVLSEVLDGADAYVVWRMQATYRAAGRTISSDTIGATHLRFDDTGRIILQQDFWDPAAGVYEHLPVIGGVLRTIRSNF